MLLKNKTLYVHDVWDGKIAGELLNLSSGVRIVTADPGHNRKRLFDHIKACAPVAVIIATPCWHSPLDVLAGRYFAQTNIPLLYVVNQKFWQARIDPDQLDFFIPPAERVLFRNELNRSDFISTLHKALTRKPQLE